MANLANTMNKVKILVVGDSGVGKTSLVHLICHGEVLGNSSWTIGCGVEVRIHEFREGTPQQRPYFVELWDVGGNTSHRNARHVFYSPVHGIILTHDLTNRKSQANLHRWLAEVLVRDSSGGTGRARTPLVDEFDAEQFGGIAQVYGLKKVPVFVVGTKQDLLGTVRTPGRMRGSSIAEECSADEIYVSTQDPRSLAPGSSNAVKLSRFLDRVIERHISSGLEGSVSGLSSSSSSSSASISVSTSAATTRRAKISFSYPSSSQSSYFIG